MAEKGIDISAQQSKPLEQVPHWQHFQVVVALGAQARKAFPIRPAKPSSSPGPSRTPRPPGPARPSQAAFESAYQSLESHIKELLAAILEEPSNESKLMKQHTRSSFIHIHASTLTAALALCLLPTGCGQSPSSGLDSGGSSAAKATIQNKGSDTMVNLAQAWAEEYKKVAPDVDVEVSGGGSGVGIAALEKGTIDIANASRNMKQEEIETAKKNTGKEPKEFIVGYDALAIYVHKDNPLNEITLDQIAQIYMEGGKITKWSDLGVNDSRRARMRSCASAGNPARAPTSSCASTC